MKTHTSSREERVSKLEGAYEQVDSRLSNLTESINGLRTDMNSKFNTLVVIAAMVGTAMAGAIVTLAIAT